MFIPKLSYQTQQTIPTKPKIPNQKKTIKPYLQIKLTKLNLPNHSRQTKPNPTSQSLTHCPCHSLIIITQENLEETTEAFLEATDEVQETTDDGYIAFGDIAEATDVKKAGSSEAKTKDNKPKMCPMFWSGPTEEEEDVDMGCWGRGVSCLPGKKGCRGIQNAFIFLGYNIIKLS